ncbi:MAG: hypothetical protein AAF514_23240 [Verrucomicrobiota bacterium]
MKTFIRNRKAQPKRALGFVRTREFHVESIPLVTGQKPEKQNGGKADQIQTPLQKVAGFASGKGNTCFWLGVEGSVHVQNH